MTTILAFTIIFYVPAYLVIFKNLFWSIYLWQIKEYKLFRFWNYLRFDSEPGFKNKLFRVIPIVLLIPFIIFLVHPAFTFLLFTWALVMAFYVLEATDLFAAIVGKRVIKPKKSIRNVLILAGACFIISIPLLIILNFTLQNESALGNINSEINLSKITLSDFAIQENYGIKTIPLATVLISYVSISMLLLDILIPVIVAFMVMLTHPFAMMVRQSIISKAKQKLNRFPNLKVIAITGSYGKTTTKEILYQLLKSKFNVVKTPKNQNTDIGVALAIIKELKEGTEIFVAEMGAYRMGEIKDATKVLRPNISVVTGVNEQHISLFGSIENTFKAKYELIEALPEDGVAILNGNNEFTVRMAEKSPFREVLYFTNLEQGEVATNVKIDENKSAFPDQSGATLIATGIEKTGEEISFTLKQNNNDFSVKVKLTDLHNISNLLAAIAAALEVGMTLDEILKVLPSIDFALPHLNEKDGINDSLIIDDSYNSNPDGFIRAVNKLSENSRKNKILVTEGILELGAHKREVYGRIIPSIIKNCTKLITKDPILFDEVKKANQFFDAVLVKDPRGMIKTIIESVDSDTLVLLEGNTAPRVKERIIL